ncbi:2-dehydropantoate 2-reductase [Morganella morganii]|uniref:2-dehydropantoate 2-reductase n=1 Tax=Morganella morganii TaxID=582 RepID=UPI0011403819|nr:2-dehydropantoate 2-reductase [Morganella morganii]TPW56903.1 2-dehydropantoate 2-reductase [Morganella morganii]WLV39055.1 2-dehydropantoate 2-reductase [Morganella morganii]
MKITVLGCGAIGKLWLAALSGNHEVQGWMRIPQPYLNVNIDSLNGEPFYGQFTTNDPEFLAQTELLLVCLKAWQTSEAVNQLLPQIPKSCPVLLLHNGMGVARELSRCPNPLLTGITSHGAYEENGLLHHSRRGLTHIGPVNERARHYGHLADILHDALPDVAWHDEIDAASWQKLAVNCVISPLTVIYDCKNGGLMAHLPQIRVLCDEAAEVMLREGIHTDGDDIYEYILHVIEKTADHSSSMRRDILYGRYTEIDYITGYLLQRARYHGILLPEHIHVYSLVKQKEEQNAPFSSHLSR